MDVLRAVAGSAVGEEDICGLVGALVEVEVGTVLVGREVLFEGVDRGGAEEEVEEDLGWGLASGEEVQEPILRS